METLLGVRYYAIAAMLVIIVIIVGLYVAISTRATPPTVLSVSSCSTIKPGVTRIGDNAGLQFDVPSSLYTISEGTQDMPPFIHGYRIMPFNSSHVLEISVGHRPLDSISIDSARIFSSHYEKRSILDHSGSIIGEDSWGYLSSGERWRRVLIYRGGYVVAYDNVAKKKANQFDDIINSACVMH